jgi:NAD+ kinase
MPKTAHPPQPVPHRIGLLPHPQRPDTPRMAAEMAAQLSEWDVEPLIGYLDDEEQRERLLAQDMLIVLGGDGSMLRAGHHAGPHGVPMLGVNIGRLGFLAEVQPDEWRGVLRRVTSGDYWLEPRMMLHAELQRDAASLGAFELLNEAVVGRGQLARPVSLHTDIDGGRLTTYVADGLILATPTGSTAYALAVGGPVLPPELRNLLLIPIAPHLSLERAIVLAERARVTVEVAGEQHAIFSADGQYQVELQTGDRMIAWAGPHSCQFVRVQDPMYFYRTLMRRMRREIPNHE